MGSPALPDPAVVAAAALALGDGEGTPDMAEVLVAVASVRPHSGWETARALEAASPGILEGREGYLYPVLAGLEREGRLEARWVAAPGAPPLRLYSRPGAPAPEIAPGVPVSVRTAPKRLHTAARDAARGVPGAFERESARAEILSHLEASAESYVRMGIGPDDAARRAVEDLGDTWKIRTDLGRVHRGRPVVVFPRTLGERLRALAIYDLGPLVVVLAAILLLRWQVVQAYNIPTKSMEPTLHGDEDDPDFILVDKTTFLRRDVRRWDIAVFYPPRAAERGRRGEEDGPVSAFVKRCVGLGGERLDIRGGDVYADGRLERRSVQVEDAMMVPIYDLAGDLSGAASGRSRLAPASSLVLDGTWAQRSGEWSLPSDRLQADPPAGGEARLEYRGRLINQYTDPTGIRRDDFAHSDAAGDLEVRFVAEVAGPGGVVGADLLEGEGDGAERHRLRIGPEGITVRSGDREWTSPLRRPAPRRPFEVRFRNVDDRLSVWLDGEPALRVELPARAVVPALPAPGGVEILASGGRASFGGVRILRDIVYLQGGSEPWPRTIPAGHVFMMGDNTGSSNDSRVWGPVPEKDLVGVPFAIVFPPTRARLLR